MSLQRWTNAFIWLTHALSIAYIANKVNEIVPEPYMDEIFHVPQAQTYCQGHWRDWDPKLTTPPGLYLPSAILSYYLKLSICSVPFLRGVNALLGISLPFLLNDLLATIRFGPQRPRWTLRQTFREAIVISGFPLIFFFNFLYYTDVASLVFVLLCYQQALRGRHVLSAFLGYLSLFFRQTNILWVAFVAFISIDASLKHSSPTGELARKEDLERARLIDVPVASYTLIMTSLSKPGVCLRVGGPYLPVAAAFVAFLRWNGGIVLGDKTMHVAILHIPQIYYFLVFATALLCPSLVTPSILKVTFLSLFGSLRRLMMFCMTCIALAWTVKHFTVQHPFVIADNRHYPFYVWRKILNRHPLARYAVIPAYPVAASLLYTAIVRAKVWSLLPLVAFVAVTTMTLVPSPLLEFRYFIVPYVLLRLHLRPTTRSQIVAEYILYASINALTLYLFLYRPFRWPSEHGWQRFMW